MDNKLVYTLIIGIVIIALLALGVGALVMGKSDYQRSVNVSGSGKVYVVPDVAYIYIGVRSQADKVGDALNDNNQQATAVASALKELGVEAKDIQTTAFNVYPQQEYGPDGQITRNYYTVENTVYVSVRDLTKLSNILDTVVRSGANSINGISFDVQNRAAAEAEARKLAIADARARADEIASAAGIQIGSVLNLSVYSSGSPVAVYEGKGGSMAMDVNVPVAAGQMVITAEASITYKIK